MSIPLAMYTDLVYAKLKQKCKESTTHITGNTVSIIAIPTNVVYNTIQQVRCLATTQKQRQLQLTMVTQFTLLLNNNSGAQQAN